MCPAISTLRERSVFTGVAAIVSDLNKIENSSLVEVHRTYLDVDKCNLHHFNDLYLILLRIVDL